MKYFCTILMVSLIFGFTLKGNAVEKNTYTPPEMPAYPESYEDVMQTLAPYYRAQRPLDYFFELYVIDTLKKLPTKSLSALTEFSEKHPSFFESTQGDWRAFVVSAMDLSETIDIAIWDLWIRNSSGAINDGWDYHPWHFAQNFVDNYSHDNSQVDIWTEDSLREAKKRIRMFRERGN